MGGMLPLHLVGLYGVGLGQLEWEIEGFGADDEEYPLNSAETQLAWVLDRMEMMLNETLQSDLEAVAEARSKLMPVEKASRKATKVETKPTAVEPRAASGTSLRKSITPEIRLKVKELTLAGENGSRIAQSLDISLPSVFNIRKQLGLTRKGSD